MSSVPAPRTYRMAESDLVTEFRCGESALDDFFRSTRSPTTSAALVGRTFFADAAMSRRRCRPSWPSTP